MVQNQAEATGPFQDWQQAMTPTVAVYRNQPPDCRSGTQRSAAGRLPHQYPPRHTTVTGKYHDGSDRGFRSLTTVSLILDGYSIVMSPCRFIPSSHNTAILLVAISFTYPHV